MGGYFSKQLQYDCNVLIMKNIVDVKTGGGVRSCSSTGRGRFMTLFGLLTLIYFVTAIVYGIKYGTSRSFNAKVNTYLIYNGIAFLVSMVVLGKGVNVWYGSEYADKFGRYRSDQPFISWFETVKSKDIIDKSIDINFKQFLKDHNCGPNSKNCTIYDLKGDEGLKGLSGKLISNLVKTKKGVGFKIGDQGTNYNISDTTINDLKKLKVKYVYKQKNSSYKAIDPKWNKTIKGLECESRTEGLCSSKDKNCIWISANSVNGANSANKRVGKCVEKWEPWTGANIMSCDECDRASPYCTVKWTSGIASIGFAIICILLLVSLIHTKTSFDDIDDNETIAFGWGKMGTLKDFMIIFGWILFVLLIFANYFFFMLWYTCPAGSDMGNPAMDDIGFRDHFRIAWKYLKLPFIGNWSEVLATGNF
jgi:hypothetical protein